jgi:hypothetical protein
MNFMPKQVVKVTQTPSIGLRIIFGELEMRYKNGSIVLILAALSIMAGCTLAPQTPDITPSPRPIDTPIVSPVSPLAASQAEQTTQGQVDEIIAHSIYDFNKVEIDCAQGDKETVGQSKSPVTGTLTIYLTLYDEVGNNVATQTLPNFATDPAALYAQNAKDDCLDLYKVLPYTWDGVTLVPGKTYTETIRMVVSIEHSAPVFDWRDAPMPDVVGWYERDGGTTFYHSPDDEVLFRTFAVLPIQIYLPIIYRGAE